MKTLFESVNLALQKLVVQRHPRVDPDKSSEMSRRLKRYILEKENLGPIWIGDKKRALVSSYPPLRRSVDILGESM